MKHTILLVKTILLTALMGVSMTSYAQRYETRQGRVFYGSELLMHADAKTFTDLGSGYAKDRNNVYMDGRVLENVDPSTFQLKERSTWRQHGRHETEAAPHTGYYKTTFRVYYDGKRVEDATAASFKELGGGYAKDAFRAYFYGERVKDATGASFQYLGGGYAKDAFRGYYLGERVEDALGSSFQYLGNGYAKDAFHTYFRGQRIE